MAIAFCFRAEMEPSSIHRPIMILSEAAVRSIRDGVRDANEAEVCGFLIGTTTGNHVQVEYGRQVRNIYGLRHTFAICQEDYRAVLAEVKSSHSAIVGVYHSHHGVTSLSCRDRRNMGLRPFFWLIVGTSQGSDNLKWKCFRATGAAIERFPVCGASHAVINDSAV